MKLHESHFSDRYSLIGYPAVALPWTKQMPLVVHNGNDL